LCACVCVRLRARLGEQVKAFLAAGRVIEALVLSQFLPCGSAAHREAFEVLKVCAETFYLPPLPPSPSKYVA
jgi:hypothetical protein